MSRKGKCIRQEDDYYYYLTEIGVGNGDELQIGTGDLFWSSGNALKLDCVDG
jgi:hypothetical protein